MSLFSLNRFVGTSKFLFLALALALGVTVDPDDSRAADSDVATSSVIDVSLRQFSNALRLSRRHAETPRSVANRTETEWLFGANEFLTIPCQEVSSIAAIYLGSSRVIIDLAGGRRVTNHGLFVFSICGPMLKDEVDE